MKLLSIFLFSKILFFLSVLPAWSQLIIYPAEDNPEIVIYSNDVDQYVYSKNINFYTDIDDIINNSGGNEGQLLASNNTVNTNWGYGSQENIYNQQIMKAIENNWGNYRLPISPILIKATIAIESAFKPSAVSPTGYVGLMQLGSNEATQNGLSLKPYDERLVPEKNINAGLDTLKIKHSVIVTPLELYAEKPWAIRVDNYYQTSGYPTTYQQWVLTLAAYNGGGATVIRAMDYAISSGKDPRNWSNLISSQSPTSSPLYKAIVDIFALPMLWKNITRWQLIQLKYSILPMYSKNKSTMKVDIHCHTSKYSLCSQQSPESMIEKSIKEGLDGVIITEHATLWKREELKELQNKYPDILILNGIEIRCMALKYWYDILVYGVPHNFPLPGNLTVEGVINYFKPLRCALILAHPFRYSEKIHINDKTLKKLDAIETDSSNFDDRAKKLSISLGKKLKIPLITASDSHNNKTMGLWYIETPKFSSMKEFVDIIKAGKWNNKPSSKEGVSS